MKRQDLSGKRMIVAQETTFNLSKLINFDDIAASSEMHNCKNRVIHTQKVEN